MSRSQRVRRLSFLCHPEAAQVAGISRDAPIKGFGYFLPVFGPPEQALIAGIGDEGDFRQDGRHARADQDHERGALHSPVLLDSS